MIKVKVQGEKLDTNIQKQIVKEIQSASVSIPVEIGNRTRAGKNPFGGSNRNYSQSYLEYRRKTGRTGNPVRLYYTNRMLNSIQKYNIPNGARISFNNMNARKIAYKHEFVGVGKSHIKTPFFDLDEKQKKKITNRISKKLGEIANKKVSFIKG